MQHLSGSRHLNRLADLSDFQREVQPEGLLNLNLHVARAGDFERRLLNPDIVESRRHAGKCVVPRFGGDHLPNGVGGDVGERDFRAWDGGAAGVLDVPGYLTEGLRVKWNGKGCRENRSRE